MELTLINLAKHFTDEAAARDLVEAARWDADETHIGGKRTGTAKGRPGPDSHTSAVVTLLERNGEARSRTLESVTGTRVREMPHTHVEQSATIMTDEFPLYRTITAGVAGHEVVTHKAGEYLRGNAHTNTAEGSFWQLKRSLASASHHVSAQYLHRYRCEFHCPHNTRKMDNSQRMILAIKEVAGKRLHYQQMNAR